MKKKHVSTLAFLLLAAAGMHAQKSLVLIEEFTNTGCGPCASWSPLLDSCINYRLGDCIAIKYHASFPNANDEFYQAEKEDMQTRADFYQVTAVPATFVDGMELSNRSFNMLNQLIDYLTAQPQDYVLSASRLMEGRQLGVQVQLARRPQPSDTLQQPADTENLRLFVAVVEEHIESAVAWPNGEREQNYVMRKMLTTAAGLPIPPTGTAAFEGQWAAGTNANPEQLGVVAFLQDMATRRVLATAYAGPGASKENSLKLLSLTGTPDYICMSDYYGQVVFRNDGANTVTSATLNVSVNGMVKQYPWTGALAYLERDTLLFGNFSDFPLSDGTNQVEVWLGDINATSAVSNSHTTSFANSVQATNNVQLKIYTDRKPEEISWKLYDSAGEAIREGGPYDGQARKFITVDLDLSADDCYQLEFLDAGGDGITGDFGHGYYQLFQKDETGKTSRLLQGDYSGAVHHVYFSLQNATPSGIGSKGASPELPGAKSFDLQGRSVEKPVKGLYIRDGRKIVTHSD